MGNFIIALLVALLIIAALRSTKRRLTSGCCGGGDTVKSVKVADRDSSHYQHEAVISIDGMHCENCKKRVENALNSISGVYARANVEKKNADVLMKESLTEDVLRDTVMKAGYTVTGVTVRS